VYDADGSAPLVTRDGATVQLPFSQPPLSLCHPLIATMGQGARKRASEADPAGAVAKKSRANVANPAKAQPTAAVAPAAPRAVAPPPHGGRAVGVGANWAALKASIGAGGRRPPSAPPPPPRADPSERRPAAASNDRRRVVSSLSFLLRSGLTRASVVPLFCYAA
jgi:hypothetical protein